MTLLGAGQPMGDGLYGMQAWHGVDVILGSHSCGKNGCGHPAFVAVFGKVAPDSGRVARINTCREHVEQAFVELHDAWICALVGPRDDGHGDYCPHCATRRSGPHGQGHLRRCPVGLTSREFAKVARLEWERHVQADCEVCSTYHERKPGPTG